MSGNSRDSASTLPVPRRLRPLGGPKRIGESPLPLLIWRPSHPTFRICKIHREPLHFGITGDNRFDAPRGEFGTLYVGETQEGALVETCIRDRSAGHLLTLSELGKRKLVEVTFTADLRLVDLTASGLSVIGVDNRLTTGDYKAAQRWAHAFWSHPDLPNGIFYRSRFNPSLRCLALFERSAPHCSARDLGALTDPANLRLLGEILGRYQLALL